MSSSAPLPIDDALGPLRAALGAQPNAVLVAPPGAGKTTRAPLALLDEPWAKGKRLILIEPRRLAARAAASRMAATLGEKVGETIGLRVRLQSLVSKRMRIEVVTEGVFTRQILDDPSLEGVAGVMFDEFHERSLNADLGLALALDAQQGLREDLRLLVMSATLDGARVRLALGDAPLIESKGRAYPVATRYVGRNPSARIEDEVARATLDALARESGSILVFLPGVNEIRRVAETLSARAGPDVDIAPLYGALDGYAQDLAIAPAPRGRRKIVLATSIAETSLTIEGVSVVVDSGLMRVPVYEPDVGLTRLETVRVSRANADQRRGRAGRVEPGVCYRLWEEAANGGLQPYAAPEILSADLSGLLLDCALWGVADPGKLAFLDPPPRGALAEARALLASLGAVDSEGRITDEGRKIAGLALPPRLARMIVDAARAGDARTASEVAVVLTERGLGGDSVDLASRLEAFAHDRSERANDARRLARALATRATEALTLIWPRYARPPSPASGRRVSPPLPQRASKDARLSTGYAGEGRGEGALLASAYPDRIGAARGRRGDFLMANGRAAALEAHDALAAEPFLSIGEIAGRAASARILLAAPLSLDDIEAVAGASIKAADELTFDRASFSLRARRRRRLGALVLAEQTLAVPQGETAALALAHGVLSLGLQRLPWTNAVKQWRDRVMFLRRAEGDVWPDLSDEALARDPGWLATFLLGKTRLNEIGAHDLVKALSAALPWELARRLDNEAPTHFLAPTGTAAPIDYESVGGPTIALKVQELFGLKEHPSLAGGRIPLTLQLLSPALRPIQITRDLPGFWRGSWSAVRADLRGRYPRHFWPDDPAQAAPTARAKPRGT
jgi:ATP-dependent helicase HrpB